MNIHLQEKKVKGLSDGVAVLSLGNVGSGVSEGFFCVESVTAYGFNSFSVGGHVGAPDGVTRFLSGAPSGAYPSPGEIHLQGKSLFFKNQFQICFQLVCARGKAGRPTGSSGKCFACHCV
jgi:hypothetical protein